MNFRRLVNECKKITELAKEDASMFDLEKVGEDMFHWTAIIIGPEDSLYAGYKFKLDICLPNDYPSSALNMKFITPIKHINVNNEGNICMDILKNKWSSALNMRSVLISLISLLSDPNPDDPFNPTLAELFNRDHKIYENEIRNECERSAIRI